MTVMPATGVLSKRGSSAAASASPTVQVLVWRPASETDAQLLAQAACFEGCQLAIACDGGQGDAHPRVDEEDGDEEGEPQGLEADLETGLEIERMQFAALFATEDRAIGMTSFVENGPGKASFVGR